MQFFSLNSMNTYKSHWDSATSGPLFAARKKKDKRGAKLKPITQTGNTSGVVTPTDELRANTATLLNLSGDTFTNMGSSPSLAPILGFLTRVEGSPEFQSGNDSMKKLAEGTLQTAKTMLQGKKISDAERLSAANTHAIKLFRSSTTRNDLVRFLTLMNVPIMDANEHEWIKHLLEKQHAAAMFFHPTSLYGLDPNWQPEKPFDMPGMTPEFQELSNQMNQEKSLRVFATAEPTEAMIKRDGKQVSKNYLKHETYHFLQFIMGIPFRGPSREADYRAQEIKSKFIQKLMQYNSTDAKEREEALKFQEKLITELMDEAFKEVSAPLKKLQELKKTEGELSAESTRLQGLDQATITANKSQIQREVAALSHKLQVHQTQTKRVQAEIAKVQKTEKWKALDEFIKLQEQKASHALDVYDPKFQEAYLTFLRTQLSKYPSSDSPKDRSVGAAIRRIAHRELEVYDLMLDHRDTMGFDRKFNLANLQAWLFYKLLENESHRYDKDIV